MRFQSAASTAVLTALIAPALLVSAVPVLDPTTVGKTAPAPPPSIQHGKSHITRPGEGGSGVPHRFDAKEQSKEPRRPTGLGVRKSSQKKVTGVAERDLMDFDFESLLARALEDLGLETRTPKRPGEGGSGIPPRFDTNPQPKEPNRPTGVGYKWQQDQLKRAGEKKKAAEKKKVASLTGRDFVDDDLESLFARELEEFDIEARAPTRPGEGGSGTPPRVKTPPPKEPNRPTGVGYKWQQDMLKKAGEKKKEAEKKKVASLTGRDFIDDDLESLFGRELEEFDIEARTPNRPGEGGSGIPPRIDTNPQPKEPNRPTGVGYKWQQEKMKKVAEKKKEAQKKQVASLTGRDFIDDDLESLFARELEEFDIEARTPNLSGEGGSGIPRRIVTNPQPKATDIGYKWQQHQLKKEEEKKKAAQKNQVASLTGRDFVDDDLESLFGRELEEFDIEARAPTRPGEGGSGIPPRVKTPPPKEPNRPTGVGYKWQQDMLKKAGEKKKEAEKKKGQGAGAVAGRDLVDEESVLALRDFVATFLDELD